MQYYLKEAVRWLWFPVLFFALLTAIRVLANEKVQAPVYNDGDWWVYNVKEWDFITQRNDYLNGEYEFVYRGGNLEIFSILGEKKVAITPGTREANILGALFNIEKYVKFPFPKDKLEDKTVGTRNFKKILKIENADFAPAGRMQVVVDRTYFYSPECECFAFHLMDSSRQTGVGGKRSAELVRFGNASKEDRAVIKIR